MRKLIRYAPALACLLARGHLLIEDLPGLDQAVPAFLDLLRGGNTGKMIVKLADDPA